MVSDENRKSSGKWWKKVIALVNDKKAMTVISDENSDSSDKW